MRKSGILKLSEDNIGKFFNENKGNNKFEPITSKVTIKRITGQAKNGRRYLQYIKTVKHLNPAYIKNYKSIRKGRPIGKWVKET